MSISQKNSMINSLIGNFKSKGLEIICADIPGFKTPESIQGKKPDVIAWDSDKELYHVGSVLNPNEITPEKLGDKLGTLSNMMMSKGKSASQLIPFYLGVPQKNLEKIDRILDQNKIQNNNIKTLELDDKNV